MAKQAAELALEKMEGIEVILNDDDLTDIQVFIFIFWVRRGSDSSVSAGCQAGQSSNLGGSYLYTKKHCKLDHRVREKSIIYLSKVLCLCVCVCVCVSQFVAERSAILLVLVIKLTKESRRRVWRGRDRDGEIWKGTDRRGRV